MNTIRNSFFEDELKITIGENKLRFDESMKKHTTWRVGGPADYFIETNSTHELTQVLSAAKKHMLPVFVIGGGSNILVGDKGIRGVVVKHIAKEYKILGDLHGAPEQVNAYRKFVADWQDHEGEARHKAIHFHYYDEQDPNKDSDSVFVSISSGYVMSAFIEDMFNQGVTGLEKFARIPGTFGGWVYNNVHGHTQFIGEFVHSIEFLDETLHLNQGSWKDMEFMYNQSRFHKGNDVILGGVLRLFRGNVELARDQYRQVLKNKLEHQPGNSAGCVFHNVTAEEAEKHNFESVGPGYVIDKVLDWNGKKKVGGAWISAKHGNFIETDGNATAQDIDDLLDIIKQEFRSKFNIELREEFFRIGEF